MQPEAIYQRLTAIMRDVFDDDALVARPDITADDVEDWDSLSHLRLITTVQKGFGIKFSAAEIGNLNNIGDLARLIQVKAP